MEVLFSIWGASIYTHGFFTTIGVFVSAFFIYKLAQKEKLNSVMTIDAVSYAVIFGILGARITYFLLYGDKFDSFWDIFIIWQGGLVSYGGFVTGVAAVVICAKIYKEDVFRWLEIVFMAALIGLSLGRLGSFLSGEYAGIASSSIFSVGGVFPITLFEGAYLAIAFFGVMIYYSKSKRKISFEYGYLALIFYTLGRFLIDFMRADSNLIFAFGLSQIVTAGVFLATLLSFIIAIIRSEERKKDAIQRNH